MTLSREPKLFISALERIRDNRNPGGWVLTRPSEKDRGLKADPISDFVFFSLDSVLLFFPNNEIFQEWLSENFSSYKISEPNPPEHIRNIKVLYILNVKRKIFKTPVTRISQGLYRYYDH